MCSPCAPNVPSLDPDREMVVRRAAPGSVQPPAVPRRHPRRRPDPGQLPRRGAAVGHPGRREGQAAAHQYRQQRGEDGDQRLTLSAGERQAISLRVRREGVNKMINRHADEMIRSCSVRRKAIVEAEWIRLPHDDEDTTVRSANCSPHCPRPPPVGATTIVGGRPGAAPPNHAKGGPARRCPGLRVRATQRSPPASTAGLVEKRCRATEVMPLNVNTSKQLTPAPPTTSMVSDRARRCVRS